MMIEASILALDGIRHGFFTREGGVSGGLYASLNGGVGSKDNIEHVAENRARMATAVGVTPDRFVTAYQIHSPHVVVVETPWTAETRPRADAIVTRMRALAIGISTADCGPVLLADPKARVIGAAHAGWRGALTGVVEATIEAMERLGADARRNPGSARTHDPSAKLRSRLRPYRAVWRGRPGQQPVLCARGARRARHVRPARLYRFPPDAGRHPVCRRPGALHLRRSRRGFSASAAPPTGAKPTTAAMLMRLL